MQNSAAPFGLAIALTVMIFVCGVYDVVAVWTSPPRPTISAIIQDWSVRFPMIPLTVGIILGHIFFPTYPAADRKPVTQTSLTSSART